MGKNIKEPVIKSMGSQKNSVITLQAAEPTYSVNNGSIYYKEGNLKHQQVEEGLIEWVLIFF